MVDVPSGSTCRTTFRRYAYWLGATSSRACFPKRAPNAGHHLEQRSNISRLLEVCLFTLADDVLTSAAGSIGTAVELALGVLGAALTQHRESNNIAQPKVGLPMRFD
jgi:hypothetical protein